MTAKQFYKAALLLPLVAPLLAFLAPFFTRISPTGWTIGMSYFFAAVVFPYLILLLFLWIAVNKAETLSILRKVIYRALLLFLPVVFTVGGFFSGLVPIAIIDNDWTPILSILGYALIFGYAYVLLIQALYHAGCWLGWIKSWEGATGITAVLGETAGGG
ncbi:MAG: hypothetical protein LBI48_01170 [Burkholderiaceae bacterium]|nr:hypothetical protein [Burkholderiaceae bacterium]